MPKCVMRLPVTDMNNMWLKVSPRLSCYDIYIRVNRVVDDGSYRNTEKISDQKRFDQNTSY